MKAFSADLQGRPAPVWVKATLAALLVFSFVLRLWHGSTGLDSTRYFDEQFSLRNVSALLVEKGLKPSNAFYPSLSYLPQVAVLLASEGLHRATGIEALAIFGPTADGYSRTAYFLCRAISALFGALSLWALYALGRRLFSPEVGLLAAFVLAANEPHIFASAIFKPDILVVWLTLLGFGWALDAVLAPNRHHSIKTGIAIGLTVCAKYTGVGLAIPFVAGHLFRGFKERRRWLWMVVAGVVSVATFALLNPFLFTILRYIPRLWAIAESKAEAHHSTPWLVFLRELRFLFFIPHPAVFPFALAGLVGFIRLAVNRRAEIGDRTAHLMLATYILGYSALYVAGGKVFRGQNYIAVSALMALAAAWAAIGLWRWSASRFAPLRTAPAAAGTWLVLLALLLVPSTRSTYVEVVPSTLQLAGQYLTSQLAPPELRQVYYERDGKEDEPLQAGVGESRMLALFEPLLSAAPSEDLVRSDAELVRARHLDQPVFAAWRERMARGGEEVRRFPPRLFRARGHELVTFLHGWKLEGEPLPLDLQPAARPNRFRAALPAPVPAGEAVSLSLWLPLERGKKRPDLVHLNGRELPIYEMRIAGRRTRYLTARFELPPGTPEIVLDLEPSVALQAPPRAELNRWSPPPAAGGR